MNYNLRVRFILQTLFVAKCNTHKCDTHKCALHDSLFCCVFIEGGH